MCRSLKGAAHLTAVARGCCGLASSALLVGTVCGFAHHLGVIEPALVLHLTRGRPRCPAAALSACAAAAPSGASAGHGPGRRTVAPRGTAGGVVRATVPAGFSSLPVSSR